MSENKNIFRFTYVNANGNEARFKSMKQMYYYALNQAIKDSQKVEVKEEIEMGKIDHFAIRKQSEEEY